MIKKNAITHPYLGLRKEKPSAHKGERNNTSKNEISELFSIFAVHSCPPGSGSTALIESGSNTDLKQRYRYQYW
jgi:hypothetical protein